LDGVHRERADGIGKFSACCHGVLCHWRAAP
jgi:hypothetical protein